MVGGFGAGITKGVLISDTGIYSYEGAGISTGGPGASVMYSESNPTAGITSQFSAGAIYGTQGTVDVNGNRSRAQGFTTPGVSAYAVETKPVLCW